MRGRRGVAGEPFAEGQRRRARAAADLDERRAPCRRQRPDDRLGAEAVVDLVEQVVVGEVVEPQRQARGREEDLLSGLLAAQERGHVLDHGPHDGEGGHRPRIDGARLRLGAVRVARRQRAAGAVGSVAGRSADVIEQALGRELGEEPLDRDPGARRESAVRDDPGRGSPRLERGIEAEVVDDPQDRVDREAVEVLGAEDELVREELADAQVRDAREQRVEVFGPRRHAADCSAGLLNSAASHEDVRVALVRARSRRGAARRRLRPRPPAASSSSASTAWTRTSSRRCSARGSFPTSPSCRSGAATRRSRRRSRRRRPCPGPRSRRASIRAATRSSTF